MRRRRSGGAGFDFLHLPTNGLRDMQEGRRRFLMITDGFGSEFLLTPSFEFFDHLAILHLKKRKENFIRSKC